MMRAALPLLALLIALPVGAQDARRFKIEEVVLHPQACWVGRTCVPIDVSAGDPYRHLPADAVAFRAAFRSRYGLDEDQWRSQAVCSWAAGEWSGSQPAMVVRALVGDPAYQPLRVERLDVVAACKQLDGVARQLKLRPNYAEGQSAGGICNLEGWISGQLPWTRKQCTKLRPGVAEYPCCGVESPFQRRCLDDPRCFGEVEPPPPPLPPPPPPEPFCGDQTCDFTERMPATWCALDCGEQPSPSPPPSPPPSKCKPPAAFAAAIAEIERALSIGSTRQRLGARLLGPIEALIAAYREWVTTPGPPSTGGLETVLEVVIVDGLAVVAGEDGP